MSGSPEQSGEYDVVIVGAGTAGCLLANRLSADPQCRVALLEAGGSDDYIWIRVPVGYLYCIGNPRTDWCFSTEPEAGLNGRSIRYPRGKVLGGCSSINGMIYMRGQREDYDGWRDGDGFGANPGWGWDDVLPHFLRHEDFYAGADALHGAGREWRIEKPRVRWDILDAFRAAAAEQGIPPSDDFNRGDNFGCGYFDVNQRRGVRWNTARAFLRPVQGRPNLTVLTDTRAERLAFDGRRCTGVHVVRGGRPVRIAARREVILAAGAVASPQLLQLSGIGPGALLQSLGVPVLHELRGVGANLQDHLQLRMAFKVQGVRTLNTLANNPLAKLGMALQYLLTRSGPLTMSPSQLGAFAMSDPRQRAPERRVPRAAAVAGEVRRTAAPVPGVHRIGVQPATHVARVDHRALGRSSGRAEDCAELSLHRGGPAGGRRRAAPDPPHCRVLSAGALSATGVPAGAGSRK